MAMPHSDHYNDEVVQKRRLAGDDDTGREENRIRSFKSSTTQPTILQLRQQIRQKGSLIPEDREAW
jgi:hypothetical protein